MLVEIGVRYAAFPSVFRSHPPGPGAQRATTTGGQGGQGPVSRNERKLLLFLVMIFGFTLVEAVGGVLSGSLALLADAGHMRTDGIALFLAWAALRLGRRPADAPQLWLWAL